MKITELPKNKLSYEDLNIGTVFEGRYSTSKYLIVYDYLDESYKLVDLTNGFSLEDGSYESLEKIWTCNNITNIFNSELILCER